MDVRFLTAEGIETHRPEDIEALRARGGGFVWVDVPAWDEEAEGLIPEAFGLHPLAVRSCAERTHVPKVHAYPDHVLVVLNAPYPGEAGHVHLLELDQFIGLDFLLTVHGPLGEGVPLEPALRETRGVLQRVEDRRSRPASPAELSHAITAALARHMETFVSELASKVAVLERQVMKGESRDPEEALEEMFRLRHELLTVRTMAAQSREALRRMAALVRFLPPEAHPFVEDLANEFERVRGLCDGEKEFLQGVVDYYQSRTTTKINIAMERLALIAALVLPISAVAAIYGMNIIVPEQTAPLHIAGVLAIMGVMAAVMLRWAKRHGWW